MILIVGSVDTFFSYVQCLPHIEWSMPCDGILKIKGWFYVIILIIVIALYIISAKRLKKIKKQIENNFSESVNKAQIENQDIQTNIKPEIKNVVSKRIITKKTTSKKALSSKSSKTSEAKKSSSHKKSLKKK